MNDLIPSSSDCDNPQGGSGNGNNSSVYIWGHINPSDLDMQSTLECEDALFHSIANCVDHTDLVQVVIVGKSRCFLLSIDGHVYTFDPRAVIDNDRRSVEKVELVYHDNNTQNPARIVKLVRGANHLMALDIEGNIYNALMGEDFENIVLHKVTLNLPVGWGTGHDAVVVTDICSSASRVGIVTKDGFLSFDPSVDPQFSDHKHTNHTVHNSVLANLIHQPSHNSESIQPEHIEKAWISDSSTFLLTSRGRLLAHGTNDYGRLGRVGDSFPQVPKWTEIDLTELKPRPGIDGTKASGVRVKSVMATDSCTMIISETGDVFLAGRDYKGHYTGEAMMDRSRFELQRSLRHVDHISMTPLIRPNRGMMGASFHCAARTKSGQLLTWGSNAHGKLGHSFSMGDSRDNVHKQSVLEPTEVQKFRGQVVVDVDCSTDMTLCAVRHSKHVGLSSMFNSPSHADIVFLSPDNNQTIYTHRAILLARCPLLLVFIRNGSLAHILEWITVNMGTENYSRSIPWCTAEQKEADIGNLQNLSNPVQITLPSCIPDGTWYSFMHYLYTDELPGIQKNVDSSMEEISVLFQLTKFLFLFEDELRGHIKVHGKTNVAIQSLASTLRAQGSFERMDTVMGKLSNLTKEQGSPHAANSLSKLMFMCDVFIGTKTIPAQFNQSTLSEDLSMVFNCKESFSDLTLRFPSGHLIHVHRAMLASKSPGFLDSSVAAGTIQNPILLHNFSVETVVPLMQYLYSGDVGLFTWGNIVDCMHAAFQLGMWQICQHLQCMITQEHVNMHTIWNLLSMSHSISPYLQDQCVRFIVANWDIMFDTVEYRMLPPEVKATVERRAYHCNRSLVRRQDNVTMQQLMIMMEEKDREGASGTSVVESDTLNDSRQSRSTSFARRFIRSLKKLFRR